MAHAPTGTRKNAVDRARRPALSGIGALSLLLTAVIVLSTTPAVLAGSLVDPTHPISRVGSQLRRIATSAPLRASTRDNRHDQHRPWWPDAGDLTPARVGVVRVEGHASDAAPSARLPLHCLDLPPPASR
jgi:hypothetical protein